MDCRFENILPTERITISGEGRNSKSFKFGCKVVLHPTEPYNFTHRNLTCDNFFTDLDLGKQLLSNGLTIVGTVKKNKAFIPQEFQPNKAREVKSSLFGFTKDFTLVSYVPAKSRAVILLSSMYHSPDIVAEKSNKPDITLYYNETKGVVDSLNQLVHTYPCKRKTNRWPVAFFMNLLDVCGVAAYVIWTTLYPQWNERKQKSRRRLFLVDLAE